MNWSLDSNTTWVLAGCVLLGISSGVLGTFALLRRRSLMGDALAHAALPGVCLAYLAVGTRSLPMFLLGAMLAGLAGAFLIQAITRYSRVKEDAALGLVLSVFFGFGVVLLTFIQQSGKSSQAGLDKFIFGQAASLVGSDVQAMAGSALAVCLCALALFKELKLLCFDAGFASGLGFPVGVLDGVLMLLIVLAVVIGLQAVGVVLMSAMLITPAAAARLWTDRLNVMVCLSGAFGAAAGALGTWMSGLAEKMPTGPLIVLAATAVFLVSLLLAPRKGVLARLQRLVLLRRRVGREHLLRSLYETAEASGDWKSATPAERLASRRGQNPASLLGSLRSLRALGLVESRPTGWVLTDAGLAEAHRVVRNHRLWEIFLMHEGQLAVDHVDRDADFIEHLLPADVVAELERLLHVHGMAPGLPPSVHPLADA